MQRGSNLFLAVFPACIVSQACARPCKALEPAAERAPPARHPRGCTPAPMVHASPPSRQSSPLIDAAMRPPRSARPAPSGRPVLIAAAAFICLLVVLLRGEERERAPGAPNWCPKCTQPLCQSLLLPCLPCRLRLALHRH